jgi:hypothetical protein
MVAALFRSWASRYLSRHTSQMAAINASARPPLTMRSKCRRTSACMKPFSDGGWRCDKVNLSIG